jgi:hypothetical protein
MTKDASFVSEMIFNSEVDSSIVRNGDCRVRSSASQRALSSGMASISNS